MQLIGQTTAFNERKVFQSENYSTDANQPGAGERTVFVKGKPIDTSITSYQISADTANGITVNGTTYGWADIKNANGDSLADGMQDDTFSFDFNGLTVEIGVSSNVVERLKISFC